MGEELDGLGLAGRSEAPPMTGGNREAAVSALIVLGYSRAEAVKAVSGVTGADAMATEEIIRNALKNT